MKLTIDIPDDLAGDAATAAAATDRTVERAVLDWIASGVNEVPVERLPDDRLLALCGHMMSEVDREELGDLLADNSEGVLDEDGRRRLDALMADYERQLLLKARALREAGRRGLPVEPADGQA